METHHLVTCEVFLNVQKKELIVHRMQDSVGIYYYRKEIN